MEAVVAMRVAALRAVALVGVGAAALLLLAPLPPMTAAGLTGWCASGSPDVLLGRVAALGGWCCLGWVAAAVAISWLAGLPGSAGVAADRVSGWLVPRTLRHTVEAAFGLSVAALPVAVPATAALAGDHPPSPTWTPPSLDRPVAQSAPPPTAQPSPPRWYVVRPGDCLWTIARAHLPGSRSNAAVAAAWPTWYAANRHAIGPDPDLIRVGLHLHEPRGLEVAP